jgi:hypothetical protein
MTVVLNSLLPMVETTVDGWGVTTRFVSDVDGELTIAIPAVDVREWLPPNTLVAEWEEIDVLTEYVNAGRDELKPELPREIKDVFEWVVQSVVVTADGGVVVVTPKSWEARTI